jgi:hypothetical protein
MSLQDILSAFANFLNGLFNPKSQVPNVPPGGGAQPVHRKVSLIIFNPSIPSAGGRKLADVMNWNNANDLAAGYASDLQTTSAGYANFDIVERNEVDRFPVKADKFLYNPDDFVHALQTGTGFHQPDTADYYTILKDFDIINKINSGAIDEVWMFGFPYSGFYESRMVGPEAFWCNAPPIIDIPNCSRRFVMMGFNHERGVGEMEESFNHRAEYILQHVFNSSAPADNLWERFTRYDKTSPGLAEVGSVHYAPNSQTDYDWGNMTNVQSRCNNWYHFPDLTGAPVMVNCGEWGNGDIRGHHTWWLRHLPHITGRMNGISYNWWEYVVDPNNVR